MYQLDRLGILQVEREAALAGIELAEIRAVAVAKRRTQPHVIAFRRLDLDDIRADIGEQPRAIRTGQHDREIEHADALERRGLLLLCLHPKSPIAEARGHAAQ